MLQDPGPWCCRSGLLWGWPIKIKVVPDQFKQDGWCQSITSVGFNFPARSDFLCLSWRRFSSQPFHRPFSHWHQRNSYQHSSKGGQVSDFFLCISLQQVNRTLAPLGSDRFYQLVQNGFYNQSALFRVVPGFVLQFGISGLQFRLRSSWVKSSQVP